MAFLNYITAISNITCYFPIVATYRRKDYLTCGALCFVSAASFVSHLFETHKHDMSGIMPVSKTTSYFLNRIDVLGCSIISIRLLYLFLIKMENKKIIFQMMKHYKTLLLCSLPLLLLTISETDKLNPRLRTRYVITHSLWHLTVFPAINYLLKKIIY